MGCFYLCMNYFSCVAIYYLHVCLIIFIYYWFHNSIGSSVMRSIILSNQWMWTEQLTFITHVFNTKVRRLVSILLQSVSDMYTFFILYRYNYQSIIINPQRRRPIINLKESEWLAFMTNTTESILHGLKTCNHILKLPKE